MYLLAGTVPLRRDRRPSCWTLSALSNYRVLSDDGLTWYAAVDRATALLVWVAGVSPPYDIGLIFVGVFLEWEAE